MEEARPLAVMSQPTAQGGNNYKEEKGRVTLNLAQSSKTGGPTIRTSKGGISTGEGSVQYWQGRV